MGTSYRCDKCHKMYIRKGKCPYCGGKGYPISTYDFNPGDRHSWGPARPMPQNWDEDD